MSTIKIITTQNIELEFELANIGERLVAWLIDLVIFILYFFAVLLIINFLDLDIRHLENKPWQAISLGLLIGSPFIFYNLACEIWLNGQTVGKKVMGIKVVGITGGQVSFSQYLIRWVFRLVDIYLFNGLPAFVCILISDHKQRIGDIVAGTAVIRTRARSSLQHTLFVPTLQPAYAVSFSEIAQLTDRDMQLVKEVINLVNQTGNTLLASHTAEKIKEILQIQSDMEPFYFLQVILADYNYLTSMSTT
jgi:uncharacterized RDD family membrane protein YckC